MIWKEEHTHSPKQLSATAAMPSPHWCPAGLCPETALPLPAPWPGSPLTAQQNPPMGFGPMDGQHALDKECIRNKIMLVPQEYSQYNQIK